MAGRDDSLWVALSCNRPKPAGRWAGPSAPVALKGGLQMAMTRTNGSKVRDISIYSRGVSRSTRIIADFLGIGEIAN